MVVPLKANRRVLTWLCIYPAAEGTSKWKKLTYNVFTSSIFAYNVFAISVSIQSFDNDIEQFVFTMLHFVAEVNSVYIFTTTLNLRHEITATINQLTEIYRKCICFECQISFKTKIRFKLFLISFKFRCG